MQIDWFRESTAGSAGGNGSSFLDKHGNDWYDIHEQPTEFGLSSYMQIRQLRPADGLEPLLLYKCLARNEFGFSERLIKLLALGVPRPPGELRVRDVWSRSALISWQPPLASADSQQQQTGRVANYTVQYWRKNPTSGASPSPKQNHRRDDLVVDGLHTSALLVNLLPAITYEVSVIAHNQVGRSEPSEPINVTTSEEEPAAPPTDVQVEPRGSSTLRVMWKVPPGETLNGKLLGFYVGYRPRFFSNAQLATPLPSVATQLTGQQQQSASMLQSVIYSFKTADAFEGQHHYETFLANLKHNQEYEITVRAFNKAGSGPDCHVITARTSGQASKLLPQAPNLQVQRVTPNSVTLKWTATVFVAPARATIALQPSGDTILRYVLYYQIQGERDWYELTVGRQDLAASASNDLADPSPTTAGGGESSDPLMSAAATAGELITSQASVHTLSNLQPGYIYRIYVAAASDYGIGDPSNVVTLRTDLLNGSATNIQQRAAYLGAAVLDDSGSKSSGGFFEQWGRQQQQWGLLYTSLTVGALICLLIVLAIYLIYQHKARNKYNSSSASSYPSSWTPAASDTIQSEYSVKRFPPTTGSGGSGQPPPTTTAPDLFGDSSEMPPPRTSRFRQQHQQQQLLRNQSATTARPMPQLSSHYHQPADLISNSSTLQLHSHSAGGNFRLQGGQSQKLTSATLNRNQNRQLPPIPYSTMSVKETIGDPMSRRLQHQQDTSYRLCQQQQQSLLRPTKQQQHKKQMATSQTPLIYGVIE